VLVEEMSDDDAQPAAAGLPYSPTPSRGRSGAGSRGGSGSSAYNAAAARYVPRLPHGSAAQQGVLMAPGGQMMPYNPQAILQGSFARAQAAGNASRNLTHMQMMHALGAAQAFNATAYQLAMQGGLGAPEFDERFHPF
jgi:hypothetical protein